MTNRPLLLLAAATLALAACGGQQATPKTTRTVTVTPGAPTSSPGATTSGQTGATGPTSSAGQSTSAGGGTPATVHEAIYLTGADGKPDAGWSVKDTDEDLSCSGESPVADTAGTYSCGAVAQAAFACVAEAGGSHVLCSTDPWGREMVRFRVQGRLPTTRAPQEPHPFGIELADGSRWGFRAGGAWPSGPDDAAATYGCLQGCKQDEALLTPPGNPGDFGLIREGEVWYARRGRLASEPAALPKPTKERIAKVFFLRARQGADTGGGGAASGPLPGGGQASTSATSPTATASASAPAKKVSLPYTIKTKADADALPDVGNLRSFAHSELKRWASCGSGLTIKRTDWSTTAYVSNNCDNAALIWGSKKGTWKQVFGAMEAPSCQVLRDSGYQLDGKVVGECDNMDGTYPQYSG